MRDPMPLHWPVVVMLKAVVAPDSPEGAAFAVNELLGVEGGAVEAEEGGWDGGEGDSE